LSYAGFATWLAEDGADLGVLGEAPRFLLREDDLSIAEHVELALPAGLELGGVLGLAVQLGRETRGPFVVAVSDRAVEDLYARHSENLPKTLRAIIIPHTV
jgi:hypothetical protein